MEEKIQEEVKIQDEAKPQESAKKPLYMVKYTLDGEILVEVDAKGNPLKEFPLKTVPLLLTPNGFQEKHMIELKLFHSLMLTVKKHRPNRSVPVTRKEFLSAGGSAKLLKQLEGFGFLREAIVPLLSEGGTNPGSRACIYYTPQGRALIRERLDPEYAKTDYN